MQGSVSILSHSLGTVLCYDLLCAQPLSPQLVDGASLLPHTAPEAAGSPQGQAMQSLPSTPPRPPLRSAGQSPGGSRGRSRAEGGDDMAIDLTADSPTAAMQQELSRLRGENQRLQLQLEVARAQGSFGGSLPESQMQQSPPPTDQAVAAEQSEAAEWPGLQFRSVLPCIPSVKELPWRECRCTHRKRAFFQSVLSSLHPSDPGMALPALQRGHADHAGLPAGLLFGAAWRQRGEGHGPGHRSFCAADAGAALNGRLAATCMGFVFWHLVLVAATVCAFPLNCCRLHCSWRLGSHFPLMACQQCAAC